MLNDLHARLTLKLKWRLAVLESAPWRLGPWGDDQDGD